MLRCRRKMPPPVELGSGLSVDPRRALVLLTPFLEVVCSHHR
jgi:hypothetical protein